MMAPVLHDEVPMARSGVGEWVVRPAAPQDVEALTALATARG
jgi:hypothetical protein